MAAISHLHWFPSCGRWKDLGGKWRLLDIIVKITDLQLPGLTVIKLQSTLEAHIRFRWENPEKQECVLRQAQVKSQLHISKMGSADHPLWFSFIVCHAYLLWLLCRRRCKESIISSYRSRERGSGQQKSSQHPHHRRLKNVLATADPKKTSRGWNLIVLIVSLMV